MKKEIWKAIPDYSYHEASTLGRIRSIDRTITTSRCTRFYPRRILKSYKTIRGYKIIGLYNTSSKKRITRYAHTLIALTFLGPRPKGLEVAHLNGIAIDNRIENLMWATAKENQSHRHIHGTILTGERSPVSKLKTKDVLEIRKLCEQKISYKEIAKKYGISSAHVCSISSRKSWAHVA